MKSTAVTPGVSRLGLIEEKHRTWSKNPWRSIDLKLIWDIVGRLAISALWTMSTSLRMFVHGWWREIMSGSSKSYWDFDPCVRDSCLAIQNHLHASMIMHGYGCLHGVLTTFRQSVGNGFVHGFFHLILYKLSCYICTDTLYITQTLSGSEWNGRNIIAR